jgi:hypothetical protein
MASWKPQRHQVLAPTFEGVTCDGVLVDIETVHLDRRYDYPVIRTELTKARLTDLNIQRRAKPGDGQ